MKKAAIKALSIYLPKRCVANDEVEALVANEDFLLPPKFLKKLFGSAYRYYAAENEQVSDMATRAAISLFNQINKSDIDLMIFAAASSDLIEPATAAIIQQKLALKCPVFDIKNACNSFTTAMQIASTFVEANVYKNVLIVNGEKLSEVINFNPTSKEKLSLSLAGYTLGDAGAAMILGRDGHEILYQKLMSDGSFWGVCTVMGGGSQAFRNPDKYFFETDAIALKNAIALHTAPFVTKCLAEAKMKLEDINWVVPHQVSGSTCKQLADALRIEESRFVNTFAQYGNTAAATIPIALHQAVNSKKIKRGDTILLLGLAAGISISVQIIKW